MRILRTVAEAQTACAHTRAEGKRLGLVPTMGALHEGHLSLVRSARAQCDVVAVSIFVNPLQFGPNEDFARYPRTFEQDCSRLESKGVDLVFSPSPEEMYGPPEQRALTTFVEVPLLSDKLEGRTRPGHFRGVTTVVSKLFHVIAPDFAFFGQKDAQQAIIIQRMVQDLNLPVKVVICPIVREADGLAMSSRNVYLDPEQRRAATVLHRALLRLQTLADTGEQDAAKLAEAGRKVIEEEPLVRLDYLEVVDQQTLDPIEEVSRGALVVVAAYLGPTRLIDNVLLHGVGQSLSPNLSER
jgi:pantoate--beta-alanine ligase